MPTLLAFSRPSAAALCCALLTRALAPLPGTIAAPRRSAPRMLPLMAAKASGDISYLYLDSGRLRQHISPLARFHWLSRISIN